VTPTDRVDVLMIGGGVASVRCARTLRRHGFAGSILLVGDEPVHPYNRPPLSKELLRDDLPDELVLAEPETWYARRDVGVRLDTSVVHLDSVERTAEMQDGYRVTFGHCLLATGAEPRRPPIPGAELGMVLRTLADAHRLGAAAGPGTRTVIIGGGFIGVEVASSLASRGARVLVAELADELWGGSLGTELSAWARERLAEAGVTVMTRTAATAIEDRGVRLGADLVEADLVLLAVGVTPRIGLAAAAGLEVDDGVVTDRQHRTSAPSIFAAGDVARVAGVRVEHWHAAREGGERAALAMLGEAVPASPAPWIFSEVAGHQLDVVGSAPAAIDVRRIGDDRRFVLAYVSDGVVRQIAIVNAAVPVEEARALVGRRRSIAGLEHMVRGSRV
jgi:3-phenylpropionate/trans-cinnamate dioxygenase ferredoxin reductase component